jgi:hypothetical protein
VKRFVTAIAVALAVALLVPAVASAAPKPNNNADFVDFTFQDGSVVTVWVNFVGSDRGGESPVIVVAGSDAQVFKLVSYQAEGYPTMYTRFPAPSAFDLVTCTHPFGELTVTLTGVFIP